MWSPSMSHIEMGYPRRVHAEMRCFNMDTAKYFKVGSWHVDWTRQTREVRPQNIQKRLFHGSRAIVSALLVYSQRYGGKTKFACQCFPVSRIHWNIAAQKRGRNGEDPLSESPRCPPPSMPSLQFIRLHNYTIVFNKQLCGALKWADLRRCGDDIVIWFGKITKIRLQHLHPKLSTRLST